MEELAECRVQFYYIFFEIDAHLELIGVKKKELTCKDMELTEAGAVFQAQAVSVATVSATTGSVTNEDEIEDDLVKRSVQEHQLGTTSR